MKHTITFNFLLSNLGKYKHFPLYKRQGKDNGEGVVV